jgi:DSF synthase
MNHIAGNPTVENEKVLSQFNYLPSPIQKPNPGNECPKSLSENNNIQNTEYNQLEQHYDAPSKALWLFMQATPRPCFSQDLLSDLHNVTQNVVLENHRSRMVDYLVTASGIPGIYNLGGDLDAFQKLIQAGDREGLRSYAYSCVELIYNNSISYNQDVTTIALVQGQAMGGGFECALSCNVLVAEESAKMGFPEILFNLFPGMGAHPLLSQRVHPGLADRIIQSGRTYTAGELYEMGIVDVLAKDGEGTIEVNKYIKQHQKKRTGNLAMQRVKQVMNPITLRQLKEITNIWVDAALQLDERSLRIMAKLVNRQNLVK